MDTTRKESRKHQRVDTFNHVLIGYNGAFIPGIAVNLSPTGILIDTQRPPKALPIELEVYITCGKNKTLCLPAQVAHINGSRVGLQLTSDGTVDINLCAYTVSG